MSLKLCGCFVQDLQDGVVRLAPLYDLASILPYPDVDVSKVKLAMKIGGEYRLGNIGLRHWQKLATELRLDEEKLIDRIRAIAQAMPDQAAAIQKQIEEEGLSCDHHKIMQTACYAGGGLSKNTATPQFKCHAPRPKDEATPVRRPGCYVAVFITMRIA